MKVAFGFKAHSGWAVLVVIGEVRGDLIVVDRRRIELVEETWAKQPYHAAERLERAAAREVVRRGIDAARRIALAEVRMAIQRERERNNEVSGCAVVVGSPMPDWSTEDVLAVHFRMHKAEGALFQDALVRAARKCKLDPLSVFEKELMDRTSDTLVRRIAGLGKSVGAPWGKDQKEAAVAAFAAIHKNL